MTRDVTLYNIIVTTAESRGVVQRHDSRSADRGDMFIPRTRLRRSKRTFSIAAQPPRLWNRPYPLVYAIFRTVNNLSGIWTRFCYVSVKISIY